MVWPSYIGRRESLLAEWLPIAGGGVGLEQLFEDRGDRVDGMECAQREELRLVRRKGHTVQGSVERGDVIGIVFRMRLQAAKCGCGQTRSHPDLVSLLRHRRIACEPAHIHVD